MLKKAARIPVFLAVIGAFFNTADLLAEFQPPGRAWVGYIAAASIGLALLLCVEAMMRRATWPVIGGVVLFAVAEITGQILHAALVRADVVVMTDTLRWIMGYVSPSMVVVAGLVMAFVAHYGFVDESKPRALTVADLDTLRREVALPPAVREDNGSKTTRSKSLHDVAAGRTPAQRKDVSGLRGGHSSRTNRKAAKV